MYHLTPSVSPTDVPQTLAFAQTGERVCFPLSPLCASEFLSTLAYLRALRGGDAPSPDAPAAATGSSVTAAHRARAHAALSPSYAVLAGADADALVLRDARGVVGAGAGSGADVDMGVDGGADVAANNSSAPAQTQAQTLATTVSYVLCLPRAWSPVGAVDTGRARARVTPSLLAPLLAARAGDAAASLSLAAPHGLARTELRVSVGARGSGVRVDLLGSDHAAGAGAGDAALLAAAHAIAAAAVADLTMAALVGQAMCARAAAARIAECDGGDGVPGGGNKMAKRARAGDSGAHETGALLTAVAIRVGAVHVALELACGVTLTIRAVREGDEAALGGGGGHAVEAAVANELARTAREGLIDDACLARVCEVVAVSFSATPAQ